MENTEKFRHLPDALLPWYDINKRELPWRKDRNPYHIWISEIMLQQTRVEAVKGYYTRFLARLPTVADLAAADEEVLQKLWEGLGYYTRMRNLKKAANLLMENYNGIFPRDYDTVLSLPGIGPYTAGAICSIAYDLPCPAVDGNVLRVAARILDCHAPSDQPSFKRQIEKNLKSVYPRRAGDFTQSLIELGATVCGPNREPDCNHCPCKDFCQAFACGTAKQLPVRSPKRKRKQEEKTVFILSCDGLYALRKRPSTGLLAGLWEFPNISGKLDETEALAYLEENNYKPRDIIMKLERKHVFTHVEWDMNGVYIELEKQDSRLKWMDPEQLVTSAAIPTAFRQFWEEIGHV